MDPWKIRFCTSFSILEKEKKMLKAFLCSSKHSCPEQLQQSDLELNLVDLSYAVEASPHAMFSFFTTETTREGGTIVGMGHALATLGISLAGGHLPTVEKLLKRLNKKWAVSRPSPQGS